MLRTFVVQMNAEQFRQEVMKSILEDRNLELEARPRTTKFAQPRLFILDVQMVNKLPFSVHAINTKTGDWHMIQIDKTGIHFDIQS